MQSSAAFLFRPVPRTAAACLASRRAVARAPGGGLGRTLEKCSHGLPRPHVLRRAHGMRQPWGVVDLVGCDLPMGFGDPISCGDPTGCGDHMGLCVDDPIGSYHPVGCGDPMGCGSFALPWPRGGPGSGAAGRSSAVAFRRRTTIGSGCRQMGFCEMWVDSRAQRAALETWMASWLAANCDMTGGGPFRHHDAPAERMKLRSAVAMPGVGHQPFGPVKAVRIHVHCWV